MKLSNYKKDIEPLLKKYTYEKVFRHLGGYLVM